MSRIVIDGALVSTFDKLPGPVEVYDAAGRLLGRFTPHFDPADYEGLEPQISEEELERRRQYKGRTYTTAEVLAYLEKL